jgi:cytochrome c oxidase subunit IV
MGTPVVVVQGTSVALPPRNDGGLQSDNAGETQSSKTGCRDPFFAILFYLNISAIGVVTWMYGSEVMGGESESDYSSYVYAALVFSVVSFLASGVGLFMLMACPAFMIKAGLIFSVIMSLAWAAYAFLSLGVIYGIFGLVFFFITFCYAKYVWHRIPFAAVNMLTAATAIKSNLGVTLFAVFFTLIEVGWLVLWTVALVGVYDKTIICDDSGVCSPSYGILFLLFLSLFFTHKCFKVVYMLQLPELLEPGGLHPPSPDSVREEFVIHLLGLLRQVLDQFVLARC